MRFFSFLSSLNLSTKSVVTLITLAVLFVGAGAGIFLVQQNQDLRQQAAESGCAINSTQASCTAIPGCKWEKKPVTCTMADCTAGKTGCEYTPAGESACTMTNCFAYSTCEYIEPVKASCSTFSSQGACSPGGCEWKAATTQNCTMADCTAGKSGCTLVTPTSPCTMSNCSAYSSCKLIPGEAEKKASCSSFGQGNCSPSGCWWEESKANCGWAECNSGKAGCWKGAAQTTPCTMSNCFAYPSFCTYKAGSSTSGYCSGPSGCSSFGESECKVNSYLGCGWIPGTTTSASCTGTIVLQGETCNGQYVTGGSCKGEYVSVPAKAAKCEGTYPSGATYCTGQYSVAAKCTGEYTKVPERCEGTYVSGSPKCEGEYEVGSCTGEPISEGGTPPGSTSLPSPSSKPKSSTTPEPDPTPTAECFFGISSCPTGMVKSSACSTASCPVSSAICCQQSDEEQIDNCEYGNSYCPYSTTGYSNQVYICKTDKSGYNLVNCTDGKQCPTGGVGCQVIKQQGNSSCSELGASCCVDDKDGTLSCDGGLIPNSSSPSDCKCRLPYTECSSGQKSCDGNTVQTCSSQGKWLDFTECSNRCSNGACIDNLPDGSACLSNADCASKNCQTGPGTKFCAPAGQSIGVVQAGETCGTTSYDRTCVEGHVCSSNICKAVDGTSCSANTDCVSNFCQNTVCSQKQEEKLNAGLACEINSQCLSGKCATTEFGWKACVEVAYLVDAGYQCGTDEFNQECKAPYQCINYICRVPVESTTPIEDYLSENEGLLSPEAEKPGWGEASTYLAASAVNSIYSITDAVITNPSETGQNVVQGMADHFSNLWDQALCADPRYAQSETCKNLEWYERAYVGVNMVTLGGFEDLVALYNTSGKDAMMNANNYVWNDPRRWIDNAELGIAVAGFADTVASPFVNPWSISEAPLSSTVKSLDGFSPVDEINYRFLKNYGDYVGHGSAGTTYLNGNVIAKIPTTDESLLLEMFVEQKNLYQTVAAAATPNEQLILSKAGISYLGPTADGGFRQSFVEGMPFAKFVSDGGILSPNEIAAAVNLLDESQQIVLKYGGEYALPHGDLNNVLASFPGMEGLHLQNIRVATLADGTNEVRFIDWGGFGYDPAEMSVVQAMQMEQEAFGNSLNNFFSPEGQATFNQVNQFPNPTEAESFGFFKPQPVNEPLFVGDPF